MFRQLTHNRAIECNKAWITWINRFYKDISRMHIGMEKIVTEHLGKENS